MAAVDASSPHSETRTLDSPALRELRVVCGTWNVNVALQEVVDLKDLKHYVNDEETKVQLGEWSEAVVVALRARYGGISFSVVKRVGLVGTGLIVICQTHLLRYLRDVKKARAAVGAFGVMGNKGGCGVRFKLINCDGPANGSISMCFVGVHLAAHQNEVLKRNQDWEAITSKLDFLEDDVANAIGGSSKSSSNAKPVVVGITDGSLGGHISDHDVCFAMGDLNYRIDSDNQVTVLDLIRRKEISALLSKDQLSNEMRMGRAMRGFTEASEITFPPTYKFQPGTSKYDARPDKKKRIPAWCDRILYRHAPGCDVHCDRYRACTSLVSSDHKPVSAEFRLIGVNVPARPSVSPRRSTGLRPPPPVPLAPASGPLTEFAIAIVDVKGNSHNKELSLKPGDRIEILFVVDHTTVLGVSSESNQVGLCPSRALRKIGVFESRASPELLDEAAKLVQKYRKSHQANASVSTGEMLGGKEDIELERDFMTFEDDEDDESELWVIADAHGSTWQQALIDYAAKREDEVSFRQGEMIEILSRDSGIEGWWIGRARNIDQGLVPAACFMATVPSSRGNMESKSKSPAALSRSFSFEELLSQQQPQI